MISAEAPVLFARVRQQLHLLSHFSKFTAHCIVNVIGTAAVVRGVLFISPTKHPVRRAQACEMFILELTLRSWSHSEENKRRTLQRNDIAAAITRTDIFDFLVCSRWGHPAEVPSIHAADTPLGCQTPGPLERKPMHERTHDQIQIHSTCRQHAAWVRRIYPDSKGGVAAGGHCATGRAGRRGGACAATRAGCHRSCRCPRHS